MARHLHILWQFVHRCWSHPEHTVHYHIRQVKTFPQQFVPVLRLHTGIGGHVKYILSILVSAAYRSLCAACACQKLSRGTQRNRHGKVRHLHGQHCERVPLQHISLLIQFVHVDFGVADGGRVVRAPRRHQDCHTNKAHDQIEGVHHIDPHIHNYISVECVRSGAWPLH